MPHRYNSNQHTLSSSSRIDKRMFIFVLIYIAMLILVPIIVVFGTLGLTAAITQQPPNASLFPITLSVSILLAQIVALIIFYKMYQSRVKSFIQQQIMQSRISNTKRRLIVVTLIVIAILCVIQLLSQCSPVQILDISTTSYTSVIMHSKLAILAVSLSTIIVKPMLDQLIFRYIFIHELAKKFPLRLVIPLSILCEVIVQSYHFDSIVDVIPWLIIASGATYLYISSHYNLIVSYYYQVAIEIFKLILLLIVFR
ncbi:hypothetical protein J3T65_03190 [Staphylococcus simiae]|uniref:CPBP family lipoprotein N-acylation protein LnsB n=1 Tax=Staphylococcus simiae TaxID=308354 RepID=UPI001A9745C0|nr:CPBP family lipoprotein N-acylation protein LnsB [Staphylococcus simiae]MBO1198527.1 hypothetical protein [Staphylococcus simiae]MBO1200675.1 hypothetical protein [Staphylococcus simiae]MBO1202933.1 hypothetical protein [Staphylococcus simiae]MBO1210518.1 hypothetical protein [Staphylococcus simiae]MBO1228999.1 hypothetical protein [Staphylococcus simiae]